MSCFLKDMVRWFKKPSGDENTDLRIHLLEAGPDFNSTAQLNNFAYQSKIVLIKW